MEVVRKHIRVTGTVQGVNFRNTSKKCADELGLTGWVRNETDGSVEMEVQGTSSQIEELFDMISSRNSYVNIESIEAEIIPIIEDDEGFVVIR